jgi:hypothetical protein
VRRFPTALAPFLLAALPLFGAGCVRAPAPKPAAVAPKPAPSGFATRLSDDDYATVRDELFGVMRDKDARAAIDRLKEKMAADPSVLADCHDLLHDLGREAYKKYGSIAEAAQYQDQICVSGYIHGVMEQFFDGVTDVPKAVASVCTGVSPRTFKRWECVHGVGHGLMDAYDNDLFRALATCDRYADDFDAGACANGAYMENFNADQRDHKTVYLDPARPLWPCTDETMHLGDCYMNAPIRYLALHPNDYEGAFKACAAAPTDDDRYTCSYGVGSQATRRNVGEPALVEKVCDGEKDAREPCMIGAVNALIGHYVAFGPVRAACAAYADPDDKALCARAIQDFVAQYGALPE